MVHQDEVGAVAVDRAEDLAAVADLGHHLDPSAPPSSIRSPERTSGSSSASRTRIGPPSRAAAVTGPPAGSPAAGTRPARRRQWTELAAGQADPLAEPDQAAAGPGQRRLGAAGPERRSDRLRVAQLDLHPTVLGQPRTYGDERVGGRACGRWSGPPGRSGRRWRPVSSEYVRRRAVALERQLDLRFDPHPRRPRLGDQLGQVAQRGLRRLHRQLGPLAQEADHVAQLLERGVGEARITPRPPRRSPPAARQAGTRARRRGG